MLATHLLWQLYPPTHAVDHQAMGNSNKHQKWVPQHNPLRALNISCETKQLNLGPFGKADKLGFEAQTWVGQVRGNWGQVG